MGIEEWLYRYSYIFIYKRIEEYKNMLETSEVKRFINKKISFEFELLVFKPYIFNKKNLRGVVSWHLIELKLLKREKFMID